MSFPALDRRKLPQPRTRFFGRERELEALEGIVGPGRVASIVGGPGMGKTRLALRYAEDHEAHVIWVSAAGTATSVGLAERVASTIGRGTEADAVGAALAAFGDILLVLDELDHVSSTAGPLLEEWLASAPRVTVLTTSRIRTRAVTEQTIKLEPLDEVAATKLCADRASLTTGRPQEDDEVLRVLVGRVDRIPLAIELAAGRLRTLTASELVARLDAQLELLHRRGREVSGDRHESLRAAIEGSWNALPDWGRRGLSAASTFRGGLSIEAFEQVVGSLLGDGAPSAIDVIDVLVDSSLVALVDDPRAKRSTRLVVYDSIRSYATEQLASPVGTTENHARYFGALAERLAAGVRAGEVDALDALAVDAQNFEAALDASARKSSLAMHAAQVAIGLDALARARGPLSAHEDRLSRALDSFDGDLRVRARILLMRARTRTSRGRTSEALGDVCQVQRIVDFTGNGEIESEMLGVLAVLLQSLGHIDEGIELLERRIAASANPDLVLRSLGLLLLTRGDLEQAREFFGRAFDLADRSGDANHAASLEALQGLANHEIGAFGEARVYYSSALARATRIGDRFVEAVCRNWLGQLLFDLGEREAALEEVRRARETLAEMGEAWFYRATLGYLGIFAHFGGDVAGAKLLLEDAVTRARGESDHYRLGNFLPHLGAVLAQAGDIAGARAVFVEARTHASCSPSPNLAPIASVLESFVDRSGASTRIAAAREAAKRSSDVRLAERLVVEKLGSQAPALTIAAQHDPKTLVVARDGAWFTLGEGPRADLSRRAGLKRLLVYLVDRRRSTSGLAASSEDLVCAGWPGEKVSRDAALHRVHVAVATLRRLGLGDALLKRSDGYLLEPTLEVLAFDPPAGPASP